MRVGRGVQLVCMRVGGKGGTAGGHVGGCEGGTAGGHAGEWEGGYSW